MFAAMAWICSLLWGTVGARSTRSPPQAESVTAKSVPTAASMTLPLMTSAPSTSANLQPSLWALDRPGQGRMAPNRRDHLALLAAAELAPAAHGAPPAG